MATLASDEVIGRKSELGAIERFFMAAVVGLSGLVLQGDAGIGKTTLWEEARSSAIARGFAVLSSRPTKSETALLLAGFGDLFSDVPARMLRNLPGPQRHALEVALLRAEPAGPPLDRRALSAATVSLLRELTGPAPVLIAVDDVQWLDESSAGILAYAIRRLHDRRLGVVVSLRAEGSSVDPLDMSEAVPAERLEWAGIGPLSLAALHRLFESRLGHSFPRLTLIKIEQVSGGNPFYALEIGRALERSGLTVSPGEPLPVPPTLGALMRERIHALPLRTRRALLIAAADLEPSLDVLERAGVTDPISALEPAERDGIVVLDGGSVRFSHPLLSQAVLGPADPVQLRRVHDTLATTATSEDSRAHHLGLAADGPDENTAQALEDAGRRAWLRGAPDAAAELLEHSLRLTPPERGAEFDSRLHQAAQCHFSAGEMDRARSLLEGQVQRLSPGVERARALQLLGQIRAHSASFPEALGFAARALNEVGEDAALRAEIELDTAYYAFSAGDFVAAGPHAQSAITFAQRAGVNGCLAEALSVLSVIDCLCGRAVPADRMDRALALEDPLRPSPFQSNPRAGQALLLLFTGQLDQALEAILAVRSDALERGQEITLPFMSFYLVWACLWRGDVQSAARFAEESREISELHDDASAKAISLAALAMVDAFAGRAERARGEGEDAIALLQRLGWAAGTIWPLWALGFIELSVGDHARVDALLGPMANLIAAMGFGDPILGVFMPDEIEALVSLGELERAETLTEVFEGRARELDRSWALAAGARCRGLLEAARGNLDAADAAAGRALAEHERTAMPFERARTLLVKGTVHRRRKEKRMADESLRAALRTFDELGAPLWGEKASRELGRIGLRPAAPSELTETERRVAELAAAGLTIKQIAERAFLAPKTVGNVLGRVYRKLGIHSRAELGARMTSRDR